MTLAPSSYDDEIDLRALFTTLWRARRTILAAALAFGLLALLLSLLLPRKYEASAYVFIGPPVIQFSKATTDSGLTLTPTLPDIKAVVQLAQAPGLLESVLKDPAVAAALGADEMLVSDLADSAKATDIGKDQLSLQVTDSDPQRAALIANTWAQKLIEAVNATYGMDTVAQILNTQAPLARQEYEAAQTALETALAKSQVNAISSQLDSKKAELDSVIANQVRAGRVLDDLTFFESGLKNQPGEAALTLGDGLALTTLRQRALTVASESFTVQIDAASFAGFTVARALLAAKEMRSGLETQLKNLQADQARLEQEIPQLQQQLANANAQMESFYTQRDTALGIYNNLLGRQKLISATLAEVSKVASLSVPAAVPDDNVFPKIGLNTVIGVALGGILAVFWVLVAAWWKNDQEAV
ncbi:MAG: hypothetical protein OHK0031_18200 [Anaerolineales bacterium]